MIGFDEWLRLGVAAGYVTIPTCSTHHGVMMSVAEEDEFEEGYDPCVHVLRLCHDKDEQAAVAKNNHGERAVTW